MAGSKSRKIKSAKAKSKPARAKRPAAKKAARPAAKKAPAKKAAKKKAPPKKVAKKKVAKKQAQPKKAVKKKAAPKKAAPRKSAVKKAAPQKASARKHPAQKAPSKKAPAMKAAPKAIAAPPPKPAVKHFVLSPARPQPATAPPPSPTVVKTAPRPATKPMRVVSKKEAAAPPRPVEPATPIDIEAVRRRLRAKKEELLAMYLKDLKTGQESNDSPTEDIVDRANNSYSRELNFSLSDAERGLLLQIDEALERLDSGSYGKCANCGDPIARPRLDAIPWARLCIRCQELFEQGLLAEG